MLTPGRGYSNSRLASLEEAVARLTARLPLPSGREAAGRHRRAGIHRGITVDAISHGAFGTVKLVYWDGTAYRSAKDGSGNDITVEAGGYSLNDTETIEADTAVWVHHLDDNTWEVFSGNCAVRDWTLADEA